ncbi:MAG: restriction endonuclease subunit S [Verrucomicrobiota bacterium]
MKTRQKHYQIHGKYPIVDQGQELIGGYTHDKERLCKAELPVIIFGDHTKKFKYIDFPFCLGADGTKVLRPKNGAHPKYLYYALQQAHIPEAGYSRHFKFLKQFQIPLPPLDEQKRIAAILDKADELRRLRQRAIDRLNSLGQAIFYEMFGDPLEKGKHPEQPLGKCVRLINGRAYRKHEERERGTPVLRIQNLNGGDRWFYSDMKLPEEKYCEKGDLLFAWSATFGPYIWWGEKAIYHYHIWKIECGDSVEKNYMYWLLRVLADDVKRGGRGISMTHATKSGMEARLIPVPDIDKQKRFSEVTNLMQARLQNMEDHLQLLNINFDALQSNAFRGEL